MRRTEPVRVGELLKSVVESNPKLSQLFLEARAVEAWKGIDPYIASQTMRVNVMRGRMNVWIASAALRHEIFMRRTELIAQVNKLIGHDFITALYVK